MKESLQDYVARRKMPGNCIRCARPHGGPLKTCPACREKVKARKERKAQAEIVQASRQTVAELVNRVERLELSIESLKRRMEQSRQKAWQAGVNHVRQQVAEAAGKPRFRDVMDAIFGNRLPQHIDWESLR